MSIKVLKLTLNKEAFDVMRTGEKDFEIREIKPWINSRLLFKNNTFRKEYDYVQFTNGYGKKRPKFLVQYVGLDVIKEMDRTFSNGLKVQFCTERYIIYLGKVMEEGGCG